MREELQRGMYHSPVESTGLSWGGGSAQREEGIARARDRGYGQLCF